ncbi:hypothetical protein FACS1894186_1590 [Alphaproteobacteria bacterium]|nr:hypothetical protein FACS1894186_1590 [Alphaproteobacteria bacterium]
MVSHSFQDGTDGYLLIGLDEGSVRRRYGTRSDRPYHVLALASGSLHLHLGGNLRSANVLAYGGVCVNVTELAPSAWPPRLQVCSAKYGCWTLADSAAVQEEYGCHAVSHSNSRQLSGGVLAALMDWAPENSRFNNLLQTLRDANTLLQMDDPAFVLTQEIGRKSRGRDGR